MYFSFLDRVFVVIVIDGYRKTVSQLMADNRIRGFVRFGALFTSQTPRDMARDRLCF
jgi:hypothetical protein